MIEVGDKIASAVTYTASGSVVLFGWLLSDISMVIAAIAAILGYITSLYFKWEHLQLAKKRDAANAGAEGDEG